MSHKRMHRICINYLNDQYYPEAPYDKATEEVSFKHLITALLVDSARKGDGVGCLVAMIIMENWKEFPHHCHYAEVHRRAIWIVDKLNQGMPAHIVQYYCPTAVKISDDFDKMGQAQFAEKYVGREIEFLFRPSKNRLDHNNHGVRKSNVLTLRKKIERAGIGAEKRARDAGLIPAIKEKS